MFKITIFLLAFLSLQTTVRSVTTTTNLRLVYNADATLACSSSEASTFYKTTKAGATSAISASTHYSLNGNTLVIKKLSNFLKLKPD